MSENTFTMLDGNAAAPTPIKPWSPVLVPREVIDREIERLASMPLPEDGRRATLIVHPSCTDGSMGFAPGVDVTISVMKPGEVTRALMRNSNQVEFCIRGSGVVSVGQQEKELSKWGVLSIPSMQAYYHRNTGNELWVRITYSNAPLLRKLAVHWINYEQDVAERDIQASSRGLDDGYNRKNAPDVVISEDGARLRGYEYLTDIEVVENRPLVWPWENVVEMLTRQEGDGKRNIILLYNPATERRNGTTHSFFATMFSHPAGKPARKIGRGHKHSSVAINYHFTGHGKSIVDGVEIPWKAGDLLLSGPSWSEHAHYYDEEPTFILTIQDHPLHIGMESLIWQERMDGPILNLGSETGQKGYVGPRIAG
ncbi:gentisate 1,2-dioxygenase [Paraburkholderia sp. BL23I1N1]|uniref:hypothetical protein n=1 Tax=Paraburkholderia sp. BL23I1N1 TaxID=1938802 RepID=UPI000FF58C06|nr:hypothetical protein [Paraburkholderia sp. BL23I1N1]RKE38655.1 gentisate 1,2-dioxygenase [Paraburkholderia sp. BL23I1N1]